MLILINFDGYEYYPDNYFVIEAVTLTYEINSVIS